MEAVFQLICKLRVNSPVVIRFSRKNYISVFFKEVLIMKMRMNNLPLPQGSELLLVLQING